jgi:hypothetical protein
MMMMMMISVEQQLEWVAWEPTYSDKPCFRATNDIICLGSNPDTGG